MDRQQSEFFLTIEFNRGHALIAEALESGLFNTVKAYLQILSQT